MVELVLKYIEVELSILSLLSNYIGSCFKLIKNDHRRCSILWEEGAGKVSQWIHWKFVVWSSTNFLRILWLLELHWRGWLSRSNTLRWILSIGWSRHLIARRKFLRKRKVKQLYRLFHLLILTILLSRISNWTCFELYGL